MISNKLSAFVALSTVLAVATAGGVPPVTVTTTKTETVTTTVTAASSSETCSQCNTGPIQCCNSVQPASSSAASALLGTLGIVIQDLTTPIGIDCSPISVIGVGSNSCNAEPVCCENNSFNGLVAIGCVPIIINL